ncbi:MAG: acetyl-CoA hydrolase/transferase C-terminal domain-containing protein [Tissierellia bacterium]|nr:acetyl-CoA hydrolase/transferase C-terminal domain-containing protein [Tissierellia bacterium]
MDYTKLYQEKLTDPKNIAEQIQDNWICGMDIAAAIPTALANVIAEAAKENKFKHVTMHTLLDITKLDFLREGYEDNIRATSWFSGGSLRKAVNEGRADLMPGYFRDWPKLIEDKLEFDAIFLHVSPMDKHGYFSMSLAGSVSQALLNKTKRIYLQVNEKMPRALTSPLIHISNVDGLCEITEDLPIFPPSELDENSKIIGKYIADLIPDGATIQLGIGAIPEAVGYALLDKKDLGIHTELLTDAMIELIEAGVVTNMKKPIHKGKTVATLAFGSQRMYDFIDDNRAFELHTVDYVNDPAVIAQHPNFISINGALEVDFFGQVAAESLGTQHVSGTGGQSDYVRGAIMSDGGKSFIALPSTAAGGKVSRIKPTLSEGAVISTHKNDTDYIVTEYGAVQLRGKTLRERTEALISIAHPDFREELTEEAKKRNIL